MRDKTLKGWFGHHWSVNDAEALNAKDKLLKYFVLDHETILYTLKEKKYLHKANDREEIRLADEY